MQVMPEGRGRALKGKLMPIGDKGVHRVLVPGDRVMARFDGDDALACYPGTAIELLENGQGHIMYDDGEEGDLFVRQPGKTVPDVMHIDGTYVMMSKAARATLPRKKRSKGVAKVVSAGFSFVRRSRRLSSRAVIAMPWPRGCGSSTRPTACQGWRNYSH